MNSLVIFCSNANHSNSYLATALEHFRLKMPICENKKQIGRKFIQSLNKKLVDEKAGIFVNGLM